MPSCDGLMPQAVSGCEHKEKWTATGFAKRRGNYWERAVKTQHNLPEDINIGPDAAKAKIFLSAAYDNIICWNSTEPPPLHTQKHIWHHSWDTLAL